MVPDGKSLQCRIGGASVFWMRVRVLDAADTTKPPVVRNKPFEMKWDVVVHLLVITKEQGFLQGPQVIFCELFHKR